IAFLGATAGEVFDRLGLPVLSGPLRFTGVFLPLVPVLGFWARPAAGSYSSVWFLTGLLYALLSLSRSSLAFGSPAPGRANFARRAVLQETQLAFLRHPQLWLIPFALTVLVAEHLNRDRLGKAQRNAIRYAAVSVIYLASAAETFLLGLGQDAL